MISKAQLWVLEVENVVEVVVGEVVVVVECVVGVIVDCPER